MIGMAMKVLADTDWDRLDNEGEQKEVICARDQVDKGRRRARSNERRLLKCR
jgi:hypothetical protein